MRTIPGAGPGPAGTGGAGGSVRALAIGLGTTALTFTVITAVLLLTAPGPEASGVQGAAPGAESPGETDRRRQPDDPRAPMPEPVGPVVAEDWRVVTSPQWYTAFDVPPEWDIAPEGTILSWKDEYDNWRDGIAFVLNDPAVLPDFACGEWSQEELDEAAEDGADDVLSARAVAGTRGGQGATGTEDSSLLLAANLLLANYDQNAEADSSAETEPFSNEHGITGHITTATVTGLPDDPGARCPVRDGLVIGISYLSPDNNLVGWGLMTDIGYEDELPDETIEQIVGSIRYYNAG
ncbi:membrane protein [Streptomyces xiamenensis]|uniref:Membrane protein n=2 Tax=Streptomyces xiamenensis TaxID=408015 RepID=A0A0F7FZ34_9ACTN|nr:membrane protein [Streptomyces xiamenensis]